MGVRPAAYDPLIDVVPRDRLAGILAELARDHAAALTGARSHDSYFPHPIGRPAPPVLASR